MPPIRITKHLTSDTLHLPELAPLIGHDVEIVVRDEMTRASDEFWNPPSLDELTRRQGLDPSKPTAPADADSLDDPSLWEGFDETLQRWRSEGTRKPGERE